MFEEPDAGNLLVRVCGGRVGQPVRLPGSFRYLLNHDIGIPNRLENN